MKNIELARELVKLAAKSEESIKVSRRQRLTRKADIDNKQELKKLDTSLNTVVNKVVDATDGDISKMLTIIIMVLKKTGHSSEASKIFNLFKQILKKV